MGFTINFQGELSDCNNLGYGILAYCIPYNETCKVSLKLGNEIRMLKHLALLIKIFFYVLRKVSMCWVHQSTERKLVLNKLRNTNSLNAWLFHLRRME